MKPDRITWALIAASTFLRASWSASLGADTNEAYYYAYVCNPSLSYFDHPPMVALVAALGMRLASWAPSVVGLRAGFVLLFAGSTWLLARLTSRAFGAGAGLLAALALNATGYFGLVVGTTASPDGPLLFFWLLTLDRLTVALDDPGPLAPWLAVGFGLGGALLSKYHAILLPVNFTIALLGRPSARRCLAHPGPYLALSVALIAFTPVLAWNSTHRWASFFFQGWRALGTPGFHPERLVAAIGGQCLLLFPWMWLVLARTLVRSIRRGPRCWGEPEALLLAQAVTVLGFFLAVTPLRGVMPHWPLIGFVPLIPLLARDWTEGHDGAGPHPRRIIAMGAAPCVVAVLITIQAHVGVLQHRSGKLLDLFPTPADPTVELIIWDQISRGLADHGLPRTAGTFLLADSWRSAGQLTFATRGKVPIACYSRDARSFAFWSRPEDWLGRDGILITLDGAAAQTPSFAPWFERIEPLCVIPLMRSGAIVGRARVQLCVRQTRPFPFRYPGQ